MNTLSRFNPKLHKWLWSAVTLKPYGDSLLSPQGNLWIGFVRLIVAAMAFVEGASWAYIGGFLGATPETSYIFSISLGVIIFVFVWAVDVSLMSLDVSAHRATLRKQKEGESNDEDSSAPSLLPPNHAGQPASDSDSRPFNFSNVLEYLKWPLIPVGWRTLMVVISVLVCAPFISMYVLRGEIDHEIEARFQTRLDAVKTEKQTSRDSELRDRVHQIAAAERESQQRYDAWIRARDDYRREVAGAGASRRYGDGAAAKAANSVATAARAEYEVARSRLRELQNSQEPTKSEKEVSDLETAAKAKDFDTLRVRFGIQEIPNSFLARNSVLRTFEDKPEFRRIEYSVYSLLAFLVMALFLLKYFEPATVRIYFSEARQSHWREYTQGAYDYLLDERNQSSARETNGMAVLYFCELWDNVIAPALADHDYSEAMAKVQLVKTENADRLARLGTLREAILKTEKGIDERGKDLEMASDEHSRLVAAVNELRRMEKNLLASVERETSDEVLPDINDRLDEIAQTIGEKSLSANSSHSKVSTAKATLAALNKELVQHTRSLSKLEGELAPVLALLKETEAKQLELAQAALDRVNSKK